MGLGLVMVKFCDAVENLPFAGLDSTHNIGELVTVDGSCLDGGGLGACFMLRRVV